MATLEKIRGKAGLLIVVVGVALFAFIIGDFLRSGSTFFRQSQEVVLDINGEKIKIYDYQQRLKAMEKRAEQSGTKITDEQRASLNNQLAQQYVQDYVLGQQADKLGLTVSPEELLALIIGDGVQPSMFAQQFFSRFGINGSDRAAVNDFLNHISDKQIKSQPAEQQGYLYEIQSEWQSVEKQIADTRMQEKLGALLTRSYAINDIDARYESGVPSREVAVAQAPISVIGDTSIRATDEEIKKYYNEHKEFFVQKYPSTIVQYISSQVVPSAQDMANAEVEMQKVRTEMQQQSDVEALARNYSDKFVSPSFLTSAELDRMNLGVSITEFIKTATPGEVNIPMLENNHYSLVKLVAKKSGFESLNVAIIALDSANLSKADSLCNALNEGGDFAVAARTFSADPTSRETGGVLTFPNQFTQMPDSTITEAMAQQLHLDTLFSIPSNRVIKMNQDKFVFLAKAFNPKPAVDKYKIAYIGVDANFSDETYNKKFMELNEMLNSGKPFPKLAEQARSKGLSIEENAEVTVFSDHVGNIPSSREIVSWALKAEKDEVNEKIFRCGTDYLVIAAVKDQIPSGYRPVEKIKEQIANQLRVEKQGEKLVADLKAKKLDNLEAYASAMNTKIDTLAGISYSPRGGEAAELAGYAMSTPLTKLSEPFAARNYVMVVKPLTQNDKAAGQSVEAQIAQKRRALGQQTAYRAFRKMLDQVPVTDNRARFY